jgi:probable HAF family extracellular repeat protein
MSHWKSFRFAVFAALCLLGESDGSAHAQIATEWSDGSIINLGGLPGFDASFAFAINDTAQVVGVSQLSDGTLRATEWSGGSIITLGGLSGSVSRVRTH